jgi:hypothetical protein
MHGGIVTHGRVPAGSCSARPADDGLLAEVDDLLLRETELTEDGPGVLAHERAWADRPGSPGEPDEGPLPPVRSQGRMLDVDDDLLSS